MVMMVTDVDVLTYMLFPVFYPAMIPVAVFYFVILSPALILCV